MVDLGLLGDLLNGTLDVCGLGRRVVLAPAIVAAGLGDDSFLVGLPPIVVFD